MHGDGSSLAQQIEIAGRPVRLVGPKLEEHRPLEHELVAMLGPAQAIEQPLDDVAGQHELEVFALLAGQVHQPLPHRRRQVARLFFAHANDSK